MYKLKLLLFLKLQLLLFVYSFASIAAASGDDVTTLQLVEGGDIFLTGRHGRSQSGRRQYVAQLSVLGMMHSPNDHR